MKQLGLIRLLLLSLLICATSAADRATAATYVVDQAAPGAADTNAGTEAQPFRTVQKAGDIVKPGDSVLIMGGRYLERVEVRTSGAADQPITFRAAPRHAVVVAGFDLKGSYIRVEDFDFQQMWVNGHLAWTTR
jgi:hypothetical protein